MNKSVKKVMGVMCTTAMVMTIGSSVCAEEGKTLKVAMECGYAHLTICIYRTGKIYP